jgi:predicted component of type VI protein secretion system
MPAQLVALNEGPNILVDKPILLIGRHPECDIQIDSRKISRRHCCIAQVHDYLVIRDLDSTNGVRINGVRVVEGRLHPGDELTVGNHRYQVTWEGEVPAPSSAPPAQKKVPPPTPIHPASALPAAIPMPDDDMLEACDEPVALPDPGRPPPPLSPPAPARHGPGSTRPQPGLPADDDSIVIPENLELLPGSGSFPGGAERKQA